MHNANNKVDYETNIKRKEKKYSWSTVFSWLFLKTIGRILPKKWNKWAENILYYNTTTGSNETHTDKTTDESAQIDLKPEVTVKESQSEIVSEDEKVQTNKDETTFQDTTMQTECVETTDKNIEADLKPEVAEKGSQSGVISKDGEVQTEENSKFTGKGCFDTIVSGEFIDEDYDSMEEVSTEEDEELKKQLEDVSQELELERSQNVLLKEEKRELQAIIEKLEENDKKLAEDADKREEELVVVKEKDMKINSLMRLNEALEQDKKEMEAEVEGLRKHLQSTQESKQQLEKEKIDLEGKLKDLNSQLSTVESKKKNLESEVNKLQEEVRTLEESKEWELAGIGDTLNKTSLSVMELLAQQLPLNNQEQQLQGEKENMEEQLKIMQQQLLNNQEQQKLEEKLKGVDKRLEGIDGETKEQTEAKAPDTVSTAKSTTESTLSKLRNLPNKLYRDKSLNNFLSRKNEELKKDFPEFKEKHFCHNVLEKTIQSLVYQNGYKFKSDKLLELLESNLKESAKKILKDKVKKLDPGKNKEIFIEESAETRMELFSDKIQELRLASSIRDKFLSSDQKMCSRIPGKENKYQLTEKAKKEYTPNSSMSHTNTASVRLLNAQRVA